MVTVDLYGPIRHTAGEKTTVVEGATVGEVLEALVEEYPDLGPELYAGEELQSAIQVFVDGRNAFSGDGFQTALEGEERVQITAAMSGGRPARCGPGRNTVPPGRVNSESRSDML